MTAAGTLSAATDVSAVTLNVANLDRVLAFYHLGVGLDVLEQDGGTVSLGRKGGGANGSDEVVLILQHAPDLASPALGSAGLYHTAILFKDQPTLASAIYSVARKYPTSFTGSSDHLVSLAFYFDDPEGNGVELYWDRPREQWPRLDGTVQMDTLPLNPNAFLQQHLTDAGAIEVDRGDATVGHVHLQVGDIPTAEAFYVDLLGFELQIRYGPQALFVSAGGYHHHLGMNTWQSRGAGLRSPALGLGSVSIVVPTTEEVLEVQRRLEAGGVTTAHDGESLRFDDPWANQIRVTASELPR